MMLEQNNNPSSDLGVVLADAKVGCNFAKHDNNFLSHYHRPGKIPRTNGSREASS